jgi:chemotaxis protein CheZ
MSNLKKQDKKVDDYSLNEMLSVSDNSKNIEKIVESILSSLETDITDLDRMMYHEISTLTKYIREARSNIANIPYEIRKQDIPKATDELDAVVLATDGAADKIMDAAEQIELIAKSVDSEASKKLSDAVTLIYEACSFQDITGQRILKVVQTLKHIEKKLEELFTSYSKGIVKSVVKEINACDHSFLGGPQLPKDAKNQDEIDEILNKINHV